MEVTEAEFSLAFWEANGAGRKLRDESGQRLVYRIADALRARAGRVRKEGRPDRASRLLWIEGQLRSGGQVTKGAYGKAKSDVEAVREELCA